MIVDCFALNDLRQTLRVEILEKISRLPLFVPLTLRSRIKVARIVYELGNLGVLSREEQ